MELLLWPDFVPLLGYVPIGQDLQTSFLTWPPPESEYFPAGHARQMDSEVPPGSELVENFPALQLMHTLLLV